MENIVEEMLMLLEVTVGFLFTHLSSRRRRSIGEILSTNSVVTLLNLLASQTVTHSHPVGSDK